VREFFKNFALLAGTILLMLFLGEIGVRLMEPRSDKQPLSRILKDSPRRFAMLPNRTVLRDGVKIHTNSLGYRGDECSRDKPRGTFRIVGLGDSYTFGAGVDYEDTYLRSLEKLLNKSRPSASVRYESMNLGVPGYNTVQELAALREDGLSLRPDLILVGYVFNDTDEVITMTSTFIATAGAIAASGATPAHFHVICRPFERPIQFSCISRTLSGQRPSSSLRPSIRSSA